MPVVVMYIWSALPCSTTLVSPPTIALRPCGGAGHGAHFRLQNFGGQAGLEHKTHHDRLRLRARNRQVVHRAVDRQLADRAAGKTQAA